MAGIPKLPGYMFHDPTQTRFHRSQTFNLCNGYKIPRSTFPAIGSREHTASSVKYIDKSDPVRFDPSLTYGRTKVETPPPFYPKYVLYAQKNLTFFGFFKQGVIESPKEFYRIRKVRIIYFLEDDTLTVFEPKTKNSGIDQGRIVKRGKIPKTQDGQCWHWKDLNVGKDFSFNGVVYHTVDCDNFTREFMASQGLIMEDKEEMPEDPWTFDRYLRTRQYTHKTKSNADKLRRFLEYDGKVLRFHAVWDDRENEYGALMKYEFLYFLSDDTVSLKEVHHKNDGRDPYSILLRRIKLPKRYTDTPATYPAIYLELSDAEVTEYYKPIDFKIGETIFVLGRDILLYDCDKFTRDYYEKALGIIQKEPLDISDPVPPPPPKQTPPHDGIGSLEDSLQNTLSFVPKRPRKDIAKALYHGNKVLRYEMVMETIHPEDTIRRFVLLYSLGDGTCRIREPPIRNSGILGGMYLRANMLIKPGSDYLNPDYYSPLDFYIGATIFVFSQRFKITGADLYVYRYMEANSDKFPPEMIEGMRKYMFNKGYLKDDVDDQLKENIESERAWDLDTSVGKQPTDIEICHKELKVGGDADPEEEKRKMKQIRQEYEDTMKHTSGILPYGIKRFDPETCPYDLRVGEIKSDVCKDDEEGEYTSYTPKHIATPEEIRSKYYAGVLKDQQDVCERKITCTEPPPLGPVEKEKEEYPVPQPIMLSKPEMPMQVCTKKNVHFSDEQIAEDPCNIDRNDLCHLKDPVTHDTCTDYQPDCIPPAPKKH